MTRTSLVWCCCVLLSLSACKDNEEEGTPDSGTPAAMTITVSGKVTGPYGGALSNVMVLIPGKEPVTSDASGSFSISGVTPPYDIVAVGSSKQAAIIHQGVTLPNPTVSIPRESVPEFKATLAGSVSGVRAPSASVREPNVVFASPVGSSYSATFSADFSTYSLNVTWYGPPTTTGTLFAFQGERASETDTVYTRFTGFGRRDNVSLSNEATVSNQNVALSSVASSSLAGTLSVPSGFTRSNTGVSLRFAPDLEVGLFSEDSPGSSFSYAVPVVANSTYKVSASAWTGDFASSTMVIKAGVAAGTHNLSLAPKAPPSLTLPQNNATNVTRTTEFSWSGLPDGVYRVVFEKEPLTGGTPYSVTLVTRATRTPLPDLSALGMAVPANTSLNWRVESVSPLTSVDPVLAGVDNTTGLLAGLTEVYFNHSPWREFTTSPTP